MLTPFFHVMINVTMTSLLYIQSLGVTIEAPPQVNIKLGFPCGCEAPTQAHKSHHQTHEAPTQIQGGFLQTESVMWCPRRFPHAQHLGSCENTYPSYKNQHSLLARKVFSPHSTSGNASRCYKINTPS
jgi:hypothetical protein